MQKTKAAPVQERARGFERVGERSERGRGERWRAGEREGEMRWGKWKRGDGIRPGNVRGTSGERQGNVRIPWGFPYGSPKELKCRLRTLYAVCCMLHAVLYAAGSRFASRSIFDWVEAPFGEAQWGGSGWAEPPPKLSVWELKCPLLILYVTFFPFFPMAEIPKPLDLGVPEVLEIIEVLENLRTLNSSKSLRSWKSFSLKSLKSLNSLKSLATKWQCKLSGVGKSSKQRTGREEEREERREERRERGERREERGARRECTSIKINTSMFFLTCFVHFHWNQLKINDFANSL